MNRLKLAVIGVGHLGRIHARGCAAWKALELVAVVDPLEEQRRICRRRMRASQRSPTTAKSWAGSTPRPGPLPRVATMLSPRLSGRRLHLFIEKPWRWNPREGESSSNSLAGRGASCKLAMSNASIRPLPPCSRTSMAPAFIEASRWGRSPDGHRQRRRAGFDDPRHRPGFGPGSGGRGPRQAMPWAFRSRPARGRGPRPRWEFENGAVAVVRRVAHQPEGRAADGRLVDSRGFASIDFALRTARLIRVSERIRRRQFNVDDLPAAERLHVKDWLFDELLPVEPLAVDDRDPLTRNWRTSPTAFAMARAPRVGGGKGKLP